MIVTRFAPSPTGFLHVGHAYSALLNWQRARDAGGRFLLRIEDIDPARCREEFTTAILEDLAWLGIDWDGPVELQSRRMAVYAEALDRLRTGGLIYPDARSRSEAGDGRARPSREQGVRALADGVAVAWRLDMQRATAGASIIEWQEGGERVQGDPREHGDVILARKDVATSYHLAVTVDDAAQGVTHVIRGRDLYDSTPVHRLLQELLALPVPVYEHHRLLEDTRTGRRFAKSDGSRSLRALRHDGVDAATLRRDLGL